jgi:hypothetical protein
MVAEVIARVDLEGCSHLLERSFPKGLRGKSFIDHVNCADFIGVIAD